MKGPIAIAVVFIKDGRGKYLFGLRPHIKDEAGEGQWACVGGKVEAGETLKDTCLREALEETNIAIKNVQFIIFKEYFYEDIQKHMIVFFHKAETENVLGFKNMEPDKCEKWEWFELDEIPEPYMEPLNQLMPELRARIRGIYA